MDHPKYTASGKGAAARGLKVAVAVQVFEEPAAKSDARQSAAPLAVGPPTAVKAPSIASSGRWSIQLMESF